MTRKDLTRVRGPEHGLDPSETREAMLERLSPCGRSVVLAFAFGLRSSRADREAVAMAVMHRMIFRTSLSERQLADATGMSRKGVRSACNRFGAAMRRCIEHEGLEAAAMFEPRRDDPGEPGDGDDPFERDGAFVPSGGRQ